MIHPKNISLLVLAIASLAMLTGCGDPNGRQKVSGTVTYKGQPIDTGSITFFSVATNSVVSGTDIIDGKFELPAELGLPPGKYKVSISQLVRKASAPKLEDAMADSPSNYQEKLPNKYHRDTELEADIESGEANELTYNLE